MTKTFLIGGALVIILVTAVALVWTSSHKQAPIPQEGVSNTPPMQGIQYQEGNLLLGQDGPQTARYLIGGTGRPVYTYAKDAEGTSTCTGACATEWPPYLVPHGSDAAKLETLLQSGVHGTLGILFRADGGNQLTFNGKPLYFYAADTETSGASGDGIGGVWQVARVNAANGGGTASGGTAGAHCGGFIKDAPTCAAGYHCQLAVSRPDTGGVCVADTAGE